jgi:hypothetical protein
MQQRWEKLSVNIQQAINQNWNNQMKLNRILLDYIFVNVTEHLT